MKEKKIPVGGWLDPTTPNHILGSASDVYDEDLNQRQSEINLEAKNTKKVSDELMVNLAGCKIVITD